MARDTRRLLFSGVFSLALVACGPEPERTRGEATSIVERPLANDEYSIVEMATAHGAFTIEIEIDRGTDTDRIARGVVEPIKDGYAEVLVYFYDRHGDRSLPIARVQWTPAAGYNEIAYSEH